MRTSPQASVVRSWVFLFGLLRAGNYYLGQYPNSGTSMEHLACFVPGMIALGIIIDKFKQTQEERLKLLEISENLAFSCYLGYNQSATGIAPDSLVFRFAKLKD